MKQFTLIQSLIHTENIPKPLQQFKVSQLILFVDYTTLYSYKEFDHNYLRHTHVVVYPNSELWRLQQ